MTRLVFAALLGAFLSCARTPGQTPIAPSATTPPLRSADYWLVLDWSQNVLEARPERTLRTVPVPVVRHLGVDVSRVRPRGGILYLGVAGAGDGRVPLVAGVDRYVFDIETGFSGFEPYQWGYLGIRSPGSSNQPYWQTIIRAVPDFIEGGP